MCALVLGGAASAQETEAKKENKIALEYTMYLLDDGIMKHDNAKKVHELSEFLTPEQRIYCYEENERSGVGPFFLNMLLGFGIGSFVQGDKGFGHMQLWGDICGYALMIPGLCMMFKGNEDTLMGGAVLTTIDSAAVGIVGTINLIRPWFYANKQNRTLKRAMRLEERRWDFSVAPIIEPVGQQYGLMAKITF